VGLGSSDAGDVSGEEVDGVSVEVASGAVVVLGGAGIGVASEDLGVAQGDASVEGVGDRGVPQRVGADVPRDLSGFRDPNDHAVCIASVNRLPGDRSQHQSPAGALPPAGLQDAQDGDGERHGGGLVALTDQVQHPVSAQGVGVVLDPRGCRLGRAQGGDPEQVGQGAVVDADGLGDLEEPDQLEPVQSLRAGLVAVDLRKPGVDGRVRWDEAVYAGETELPPDGVHHRDDRGVHQCAVAQLADVELDVGSLDPTEGDQPVGLAPGEPLAQLVGVEGVGAPGVARQVGHRRQLRGGHRCGLEREESGRTGHGVTSRGDLTTGPAPPAANAARH